MNIYGVVTATTLLASSTAPTPIYHLYQDRYHLSPFFVTLVFGVYAIALLVALLTVGKLSDYVGRRPVIFAGLVLNAAAMVFFVEAQSATMLLVARAVQGVAAGAALTALSAVILDTDRLRGPLLNAIVPFVGMTLGALVSSVLVTFAPEPMKLVFVVLFAVTAIEVILLIPMPETAARQSGILVSLVPQVRVPAQARRTLAYVTPANVAGWALTGFYLSLMPSLVRIATGLSSPLVGGVVVAALTLAAAISVMWFRNGGAARALDLGILMVVPGVALTLVGVYTQLAPLLLAGTIIAGFGIGAAFSGNARLLLPLAAPGERAGLLSAFFVQCYLAFCLPTILAGLLAPIFGLAMAAYFYGGAVIVLSIVSLLALRFNRQRA